MFNKHFYNPKVDGVCDNCDSHDFKSRVDDDVDTLSSRVKAYQDKTLLLVDFYLAKDRLITIDANLAKDEVSQAL